MATSERWQCDYCDTVNLASSAVCLVCERARSASARELSGDAVSRVGTSALPPPPPPPPIPPVHATPATSSVPTATIVDPASDGTPWWAVPAAFAAAAVVVIALVVVGLALTS